MTNNTPQDFIMVGRGCGEGWNTHTFHSPPNNLQSARHKGRRQGLVSPLLPTTYWAWLVLKPKCYKHCLKVPAKHGKGL